MALGFLLYVFVPLWLWGPIFPTHAFAVVRRILWVLYTHPLSISDLETIGRDLGTAAGPRRCTDSWPRSCLSQLSREWVLGLLHRRKTCDPSVVTRHMRGSGLVSVCHDVQEPLQPLRASPMPAIRIPGSAKDTMQGFWIVDSWVWAVCARVPCFCHFTGKPRRTPPFWGVLSKKTSHLHSRLVGMNLIGCLIYSL